MLVIDEDRRLTLVTQTDHARFAAELFGLWRADDLPRHPRRAELLQAVREHDNGWREADAAPSADPETGRPHDFRSLPAAPRREIWRRGIERYATESPEVAALIARHALALLSAESDPAESPPDGAPVAELLAWAAERRDELDLQTGVDPAELDADYGWLALTDLLSLAGCHRWADPVAAHGITARWRDGALRLAPFPLAGATTFTVPIRSIPARRYAGDADLGGELAAARWRERPIRVAPEAPPSA